MASGRPTDAVVGARTVYVPFGSYAYIGTVMDGASPMPVTSLGGPLSSDVVLSKQLRCTAEWLRNGFSADRIHPRSVRVATAAGRITGELLFLRSVMSCDWESHLQRVLIGVTLTRLRTHYLMPAKATWVDRTLKTWSTTRNGLCSVTNASGSRAATTAAPGVLFVCIPAGGLNAHGEPAAIYQNSLHLLGTHRNKWESVRPQRHLVTKTNLICKHTHHTNK